jgi:FdhD protein
MPLDEPDGAIRAVTVARFDADAFDARDDALAVEEPLEIRLVAGREEAPFTVTLRTPGCDEELATGLLLAERVIESAQAIAGFTHCPGNGNILRVQLAAGVQPQVDGLARRLASTASCGLCGKTSLDALGLQADAGAGSLEASPARIRPSLLLALPARLMCAQRSFGRTGGLHAVAAFDHAGSLLAIREDIGRHNAVDKLLGFAARSGAFEPREAVLLLSGRAGFELIQKSAVACVRVVAALGAPSSLAVEMAERCGITLVGFLNETRFNVYSHAGRIAA